MIICRIFSIFFNISIDISFNGIFIRNNLILLILHIYYVLALPLLFKILNKLFIMRFLDRLALVKLLCSSCISDLILLKTGIVQNAFIKQCIVLIVKIFLPLYL